MQGGGSSPGERCRAAATITGWDRSTMTSTGSTNSPDLPITAGPHSRAGRWVGAWTLGEASTPDHGSRRAIEAPVRRRRPVCVTFPRAHWPVTNPVCLRRYCSRQLHARRLHQPRRRRLPRPPLCALHRRSISSSSRLSLRQYAPKIRSTQDRDRWGMSLAVVAEPHQVLVSCASDSGRRNVTSKAGCTEPTLPYSSKGRGTSASMVQHPRPGRG